MTTGSSHVFSITCANCKYNSKLCHVEYARRNLESMEYLDGTLRSQELAEQDIPPLVQVSVGHSVVGRSFLIALMCVVCKIGCY